MNRCLLILTFFLMLLSLVMQAQQKNVDVLTVPAGSQYAVIDEEGTSVLPSGRFLTPAGKLVRITHSPFGMAISPDGNKAVVLHNGVFTIIDLLSLVTTRVPSYDGKISSPLLKGSFIGVAFSPNSNGLSEWGR
jgi:hypothetical protein